VPTEREFRAVAAAVSTWGRWGGDDQLGTLNLITPELVRASAELVRSGEVIPLGTDLGADGIWSGRTFRRNPIHLMTVDGGDAESFLDYTDAVGTAGTSIAAALWGKTLFRFNDDIVMMPLQAASHWDALSHVYYDGLMYNGVPAAAVTSAGAARNSIMPAARFGLVARGVLIDVARARGVDHLERNEAILPSELDAVLDTQGVQLRSGDVVLIRTGWWGQFTPAADEAAWRSGSPGLHWACAEWLSAHEVAAVAADNTAVEASRYAFEPDDVACALHLLCLRDMGLIFGELWDLESLSRRCAEDSRYDFQLVAPPLRFIGGVGSPVNPVAIR
jgi:kynurenine formamidase